MISVKIDVTKIDKEHLFKGNKGTYLDVLLVDSKDGVDQFGNDGFVAQSVSKEAKAKGIKGPIIGNFKRLDNRKQDQPKPVIKLKEDKYNFDDVPF